MIRVPGQSKSRPVKAAGAEEGAHTKHVSSGALFEVLMSKNCMLRSQNVKKTEGPRALFEVLMSKNCTPLWRKTHYEVKRLKN